MDLKQQKSALEAAIRAIALKAKQEQGGTFTPEQTTEVNAKLAELETVKKRIKEAEESAALMGKITAIHPDADGDPEGDGEKAATTPGEWFVKKVGAQLLASKGISSASVSAPEFIPGAKADTDTQTSPNAGLGPYVTQYDRTIVRAFRRRLVVADLLSSGTLTSANAVSASRFYSGTWQTLTPALTLSLRHKTKNPSGMFLISVSAVGFASVEEKKFNF